MEEDEKIEDRKFDIGENLTFVIILLVIFWWRSC